MYKRSLVCRSNTFRAFDLDVASSSLRQVWDACSESLISFDQATRSNEDSVAYIVENDVIQACLLERLKQFHIEPRLTSTVKQIQYDDTALHVQLQDETSNLRTKLLVEIERPSKSRFLFSDPCVDCCRWVSIENSRYGQYLDDEMEL